jgi:hypothetical protein
MSNGGSDVDDTEDGARRSRFEGGKLLAKPGTTSAMLNKELEGADARLAVLDSVDVRDCALTDFSFLDKCVALTHININGNGGSVLVRSPGACIVGGVFGSF